MDNNSNVRKVEKAMKEALKNDRARIQVGRISSFGLMEMSRQRLRTGVLEASTRPCPHCEGTGLVRTASSSGLSALRLIEDEAARGRGSILTLRASQEAAVYVLNRKRADIAEIEDRYGVTVEIIPDREEEGARMTVEASGPPPAYAPKIDMLLPVEEDEDDLVDEIEEEEDEEEVEEAAAEAPSQREPREDGEGGGRKRRRRRRGHRNRGGEGEQAEGEEHVEDSDADGEDAEEVNDTDTDAEDDAAETVEATDSEPREGGRRRRGRRGRRGGRRNEGGTNDAIEAANDATADEDAADEPLTIAEPIEAGDAAPVTTPLAIAEVEASDAPKTRRRPRARKAAPVVSDATPTETVEAPVAAEEPAPVVEAEAPVEAPAKPKRVRKKAAPKVAIEPAVEEAAPAVDAEAEAPAKPKRVRKKAAPKVATEPVIEEAPAAEPEAAEPATEAATTEDGTSSDTPRRGWWQRTFGA
jgi:ribonuclease E